MFKRANCHHRRWNGATTQRRCTSSHLHLSCTYADEFRSRENRERSLPSGVPRHFVFGMRSRERQFPRYKTARSTLKSACLSRNWITSLTRGEWISSSGVPLQLFRSFSSLCLSFRLTFPLLAAPLYAWERRGGSCSKSGGGCRTIERVHLGLTSYKVHLGT